MITDIIGKSAAIIEVMNTIKQVAPSSTSILITGESGTGKELVARKIHELSPVSTRPFVCVNCGAIPENLIESELFGHQKGSFTGAVSDKAGLFEVANGGTFFLDEIGELPLPMQVKLLRVIQEKTFRRVGGTKDIKVEVRILAATNRNLENEIAAGRFREDLYYRLNVILIETPPLRERGGDIPLLMDFFVKKVCKKHGRETLKFEPDVVDVISAYSFPGNVRELENVIERAVTLENGDKISISSLPPSVTGADSGDDESSELTSGGVGASAIGRAKFIQVPAPDFSSKSKVDLDSVLGSVEMKYLNAALLHSNGIKKKAADLLGITFRSFRYRLKKHEMDES